MLKQDVVIVSAVRTAFDKFGGVLKDVPSIELAAFIMKSVLEKVDLSPEKVEEVYYGTCMMAEVALHQNVPARQAMLKAGLEPSTLSLTIDRACCSSLMAVQLGYRSIILEESSVVLAAGADNMSRIPYLVDGARWGKKIGHLVMDDQLFELGYRGWNPVSVDAGEVALEEGVTRKMQDEWAIRSQQRYQKAKEAGVFEEEIVPYELDTPRGKVIFCEDQQPRPDTTMEKLAKLPTVYGSPTVTAGNAPGLNTGSAAVLLMSAEKAEELNLQPLARIIDLAGASMEPNCIAKIPAVVIEKILNRNNIGLDDVKRIEINEAFAAMPLVSSKVLANGDEAKMQEILDKTNVNGGAIALGHPLGASGARIVITLINELKRAGGGKGIAAICGGLAQGDGILLEV